MWERKVLKERAKTAFKANYWKCVLVAFVLTLIVGGGGSSFRSVLSYGNTLNPDSSTNNYLEEFSDNGDEISDYNEFLENYEKEYDDINDIPNIIGDLETGSGNGIGDDLLYGGLAAIFIVAALIGAAIGGAIGFLLLNPLEVGCRKFFLENSYGRGEDPGLMGFGFKSDYKNVVKVQFFRSIFIFLWSLLLIVPGVIKGYEYMLVPYILSDNPSMNRKECLVLSRNLMYGHKWDAFVLNLSFIGWNLLSLCTLGILGLFYVNPYIYATQAELYKVLAGRASGTADGVFVNNTFAPTPPSNDGVHEDDVYVTFEPIDDNSTFD